MTLATLPKYLVGQRDAILNIAGSRHAVWVGLLFVLSAGLVREYDGEDLLHEPWHAVLPLAASLATSAVLYGLAYLVVLCRGPGRPPFLSGYVSFLALYWMTAPLAWLYAIPYERFLSPADAVRANLLTLGVVSLWRVLLMIRVAKVFFQFSYVTAVMTVMLFADAVAITLLRIVPLPIVSIMGGVRLTESEQVIQSVAMCVCLWGIVSFPIWLVGYAGALGRQLWNAKTGKKQVSNPAQKSSTEQTWRSAPRVGLSMWIAAAISLLAGIALLPIAQREQQLRRQVETALHNGDVPAGIELMSRHQRSDFPPHWDPPPRIGYGEQSPPMLDVLEALVETDSPDWVREMFLGKIFMQADTNHHWHPEVIHMLGRNMLPHPSTTDDEQLARYHRILTQLPEGPTIAAAQRNAIEHAIEHPYPETSLTPHRRELLEDLLELSDANAAQIEPEANVEGE